MAVESDPDWPGVATRQISPVRIMAATTQNIGLRTSWCVCLRSAAARPITAAPTIDTAVM
jgi:hypothetical protein